MYIKVSLIHDIQVLIYRGSTNERLSGEGVAYDSYYSETDRVTSTGTTSTIISSKRREKTTYISDTK